MSDKASLNPIDMGAYWRAAEGQASSWQTALDNLSAILTAAQNAQSNFGAPFSAARQSEVETTLGLLVSWDRAITEDVQEVTNAVLETDGYAGWDAYVHSLRDGANDVDTRLVVDESKLDMDLVLLDGEAAVLAELDAKYDDVDLTRFDPYTTTWVVSDGDSYWSITSDLLTMYYMERDGELPEDFTDQVAIWHEELFKANGDRGAAEGFPDPGNSGLILAGAAVDVSVLFGEDGPIDLGPFLGDEVDPAEPQDLPDPVDEPDPVHEPDPVDTALEQPGHDVDWAIAALEDPAHRDEQSPEDIAAAAFYLMDGNPLLDKSRNYYGSLGFGPPNELMMAIYALAANEKAAELFMSDPKRAALLNDELPPGLTYRLNAPELYPFYADNENLHDKDIYEVWQFQTNEILEHARS